MNARSNPRFTPRNEHTMIANPTNTLFAMPAGACANPRTNGEITIHAPRRTHTHPAGLMELRSLAVVVFMSSSMEARAGDVNNREIGRRSAAFMPLQGLMESKRQDHPRPYWRITRKRAEARAPVARPSRLRVRAASRRQSCTGTVRELAGEDTCATKRTRRRQKLTN
jgi:hypothetical protein